VGGGGEGHGAVQGRILKQRKRASIVIEKKKRNRTKPGASPGGGGKGQPWGEGIYLRGWQYHQAVIRDNDRKCL